MFYQGNARGLKPGSKMSSTLWHVTIEQTSYLLIVARTLSVPFSKTSFKYNAYYPIGYARSDSQINEIRELLVSLLKNERTLKMTTSITPGPNDEDRQAFMAMQQLWKDFLGGRIPIPIRMEEKNRQADSNDREKS